MGGLDNLKAAMNKVAETLEPTVRTIQKDDDNPADKQVLIRTTQEEKDRWTEAAKSKGMPVSQFIRETLNEKAKSLLECDHPLESMILYPWAQICKQCGKRLSEEEKYELRRSGQQPRM